MQITDVAKARLEQHFAQSKDNAIRLVTRACSCCGSSLQWEYTWLSDREKRTRAQEANGIAVCMDATTEKTAIYVTMDEMDGKLILLNPFSGILHRW